jgi:hypothetical protein
MTGSPGHLTVLLGQMASRREPSSGSDNHGGDRGPIADSAEFTMSALL